MPDELVTIETFWQVNLAKFAQSRLEEVGIQAFVENEFSVMMTPHAAHPAGAKLCVKSSDVAAAREVLNLG